MPSNNTKQIASLNDAFRKSFALEAHKRNPLGVYALSDGFSNLSKVQRIEAAMKIRNFDDFNGMNDLFDEHDLGWFHLESGSQKIYWRIDYFHQIDGSQIEEYGYDVQNPADTNSTLRQLKVWLDYEP